MRADLHMHTTHSDGRLDREDLFKKAKEKNIDVISITDHDTCLDVEDNFRLSEKYRVKYIPGIELSTLYKNKSVHVLGYFKDNSYKAASMKEYYTYIKEGRENRAKAFIRNLEYYYHISITYDDLLEVSDGIIARPHIAKAIIKNYPQYTHNEVFERFIGDHAKAYVPSTELSLKEGIELLRNHNALVILAHPKLLKPTIHDQVLSHDFDGIEAIYGLNQEKESEYYKAMAKEKGWLITAGSDYHGIPNDQSHKELGDVYLEGEDLKRFLNALK